MSDEIEYLKKLVAQLNIVLQGAVNHIKPIPNDALNDLNGNVDGPNGVLDTLSDALNVRLFHGHMVGTC